MKKQIVISALFSSLLVTTGPALAANSFYLGADVTFQNETEIDFSSLSLESDNDEAFDLVAGYQFEFNEQFKLDTEVEYRSFGDVSYLNSLKYDGDGYFLNLKPKLYIANTNGAYVGALLGYGRINLNQQVIGGASTDYDDHAYQFGVEGGYQFPNGFDVSVGFRDAKTEVDNVDATITGFYVGGKYHF